MKTVSKYIDQCTRCGACKAKCPTYIEELDESMGARGRLRLLDQFEAGNIRSSKLLKYRIGTCVHCGNCDASCPAGLDIQEAMFRGKSLLRPRSFWLRQLNRAALSISRTDLLFKASRFAHLLVYKPLGLDRKFRRIPAPASVPFRRRQILFRDGVPKGRVALFVGCSINHLYPDIGEDLLDILLNLGYEVVLRQGEVCCGAPVREAGYDDVALALARRNVEIFSGMHVEAILTACPTCTLTLKVQYPKLMKVDREFTDKIIDVNQFLANRLDIDLNFNGRVMYHDPCHLLHSLSVRAEPRKLITQTGAELVTVQHQPGCCGFGGTFGFIHYDLSKKIGKRRHDELSRAGTNTLITSCPGCKMQFEDIFKEKNDEGVRILHTVEFLHEAMKSAGAGRDDR